jgi:hypothetical protein
MLMGKWRMRLLALPAHCPVLLLGNSGQQLVLAQQLGRQSCSWLILRMEGWQQRPVQRVVMVPWQGHQLC